MKVDISEPGGPYQIFVAEDNSSVYVRLLPNDAVGMDGESPYQFIYDNKTVRFTHPVASGSCGSCGPCGNGGGAFFTDHPISMTILDEYGETAKYYYLYDGLGSVTELIDEGGNVVNAYRYTPFGDALIREETVYNPYQFTGRQYDAESGLYHYRARAYSPDVARFMQQDPAGMVDGPNLYAYCGNEPVGRRDPGGMMAPVRFGYSRSVSGGAVTFSVGGTRGGESEYSDLDYGTNRCVLMCMCKGIKEGTYECEWWEYLYGYNTECYGNCILTLHLFAIMWIPRGIRRPPDWRPSGGEAHI